LGIKLDVGVDEGIRVHRSIAVLPPTLDGGPDNILLGDTFPAFTS